MAKTPSRDPPRWQAATQNEVAQFFGVTLAAVRRWREGGMPGKPKAYDLAAIARWLLGRRGDSSAKSRLEDARARIAEVEARTREGSVVPLEELESLEAEICGAFNAALLGLVSPLSAEVAHMNAREAYAAIRRRFVALLSSFEPKHDSNRETKTPKLLTAK